MSNPAREFRRHSEYRIFPAIVIVGVALLFLARNVGIDTGWLARGNNWAIFILIGAVPPLAMAYGAWRRAGHLSATAAYYLLGGVSVLWVAVMFLANLHWAAWWPVFMLIGAGYTLVHGFHNDEHRSQRYE